MVHEANYKPFRFQLLEVAGPAPNGHATAPAANGLPPTAELALDEAEVRARHHQAIDQLAMVGEPPRLALTSWEQVVGMFDNDPFIDQIMDAGEQIRASRRPR